jgi:GH35 family endo-1,4-beta-xylanase
MRAPITPPLPLNNQTYVEFDLYYPTSAASKYMRLEIWSTSSGGEGHQGFAGYAGKNRTQVYIRASDMDKIGSLNPDWIGFYNGETWYKKTINAITPVATGIWEYLNIDLHTETGSKVNGDLLLIGNIRIMQTDPEGAVIPDVVNEKHFSEVPPIRSKYNFENGKFIVGTIGTGQVLPDTIRGYHYEIFADETNLKPECHIRPPQWLRDEYPGFIFKPAEEGPEWNLPTDNYLKIRESGKYKMHGHCLSWVNQSPVWMRQIVPENISSMQWNAEGLFYIGGNNATGPYKKVDKNIARRIYFDHILYEMRHFMTTDKRYASSEERGVIPFHSFDVVNVELHESRHALLIKEDPTVWDTALRHVSWLMAMTDDDLGNIRQHYVYLLFKYAHIAVPNAQMAAKYKACYNDPEIVPDYMKMDNHDQNGSIDSYITEKPPVLVFNDYEVTTLSKAKVACNMLREINEAWKTDPLYDGRRLIECMGIQGHEMVIATMASQNQKAVAMFAALVDEGLLDSICYSELDLRQPDHAPGGEALAPAVLSEKQADCIGYQYALLFKMFDKYRKYIDHVIIWSQYGASWMNSFVPFDHEQNASQAYYGIMDPDRFIKGHSYLDEFFEGEYEKLQDDYKPDLSS